MKKNISINISGIIFHIEEDAYERLRDYLDSINKYFATFDGSQEIIADIESRIAEIFLSKLNEEKQIIIAEDVESLIATMGSIKDFQAVEDEEQDFSEESKTYERSSYSGSSSGWDDIGTKKLYRDSKRRVIGGVCAGIGHYFKIDPLWVRLLLIIVAIGSYGIFVLAYIILWVVLPEKYDLKEDQKIKKMYRNPDGKVISGVSSGVATYFGVDAAVIRLIFIATTIAFGSGAFIYIILWIILPEARSITDKVQMEGEPVTLSNIESNIKKSLNVEGSEENVFVKILLFPFRLIAAILNGLGKVLGPILTFIVEFIRVAVGVVLILTGISTAISCVVLLGVSLGLYTWGVWLDFPLEAFINMVPSYTALFSFLALAIPSVFLILLGSSVIAKRIIFSAATGWSLFALLIVSGILVSTSVTEIAFEFKERGEREEEIIYDFEGHTAILELNEVGLDDYDETRLTIRGYDGANYKLEQTFKARGRSRQEAIENTKDVTYDVVKNDSTLIFDSNIQFGRKSVFHEQKLSMVLYVPYNQKFKVDDDLRHIIRNIPYVSGYSIYDGQDRTLMFDADGTLTCLDCPEEQVIASEERDAEQNTVLDRDDSNFDKFYTFSSFNSIKVSSPFLVRIVKSDAYKVGVMAPEKDKEKTEIYVDQGQLYVEYDKDDKFDLHDFDRDDIRITIFTPNIESLEASSAAKIYMEGFEQQELTIDMNGATFAEFSDMYIQDLDLELSGASEAKISGKGDNLSAELKGASHLNADGYELKTANIVAKGASSAKVFVTQQLKKEENFASKVKYKGDPEVIEE